MFESFAGATPLEEDAIAINFKQWDRARSAGHCRCSGRFPDMGKSQSMGIFIETVYQRVNANEM